MTALTAGTPAACTATLPAVTQHITDDRLTVTLDLSGQPDLLVMLARALRRTGAMRTFLALGTHENLLGRQLAAILGEPTVRDALVLTLDEPQAVALAEALDDASIAHDCDRCGWRYAVADGLCGPCQPQNGAQE
jgi:hypothetical protein